VLSLLAAFSGGVIFAFLLGAVVAVWAVAKLMRQAQWRREWEEELWRREAASAAQAEAKRAQLQSEQVDRELLRRHIEAGGKATDHRAISFKQWSGRFDDEPESWRALCGMCRWHGPNRATRHEADADALAHNTTGNGGASPTTDIQAHIEDDVEEAFYRAKSFEGPPGKWCAICLNCGWRAPDRATKDEADIDADAHNMSEPACLRA
jgi:hypothetical protein